MATFFVHGGVSRLGSHEVQSVHLVHTMLHHISSGYIATLLWRDVTTVHAVYEVLLKQCFGF